MCRVSLLEGTRRVTIRPGTQAGTRIRLAQQGVPSSSGRIAGDMYVLVAVELPRQVWPCLNCRLA